MSEKAGLQVGAAANSSSLSEGVTRAVAVAGVARVRAVAARVVAAVIVMMTMQRVIRVR